MPMIEEPAVFYSDGLKLDASFFLPEKRLRDDNEPVFVVCSGFMGLKSIHPERFSRWLTPRGYTCFGFDYRGFATSEGSRGQVLLEEQIRDIANAVTFVSAHPLSEGRPIVLMGWGMGAGLIIEASHLAPPISALVAVNGFYDGERVQREVRGLQGWAEFRKQLEGVRIEATRTGNAPKMDPFTIYPMDPITTDYVDQVLRKNPDFGGNVLPSFAESLLQFAPERRLSHLRDVPILIVHGDKNELHPAQEAQSLYDSYPGPKDLIWIKDAGHTEWMLDENPVFQDLVIQIDEWVRKSALETRASFT